MTVQRIPWAVNGPQVPHSATLARQQNFVALGGQTGITEPDAMEVVAGETPGGFVRVGPGSGAITYAQGRRGNKNMAYASAQGQLAGVRIDSEVEIDIDETTSAGGRVDLVVMQINDPEYEGTAEQMTDEEYRNHQFVRLNVIKGVGRGVRHPHQIRGLRRPTLLLAEIDIPASESQIRDEMITDLRRMARTNTHTVQLSGEFYQDNWLDVPSSQTSWMTVATFDDIEVPEWATRASINMDMGPVYNVDDLIRGQFRVLSTGQNASIATRYTTFIARDRLWEGFSLMTAGEHALSWRTAGATSKLELQIRHWPDTEFPGTIRIRRAVAKGSITFEEAPVSSFTGGGETV